MTSNRTLSIALLLGLSLSLAPRGAEAGFVYLRADSLDLRTFPVPPAAGSATDRAELDEILRLQSTRTSAECERATREATVSPASFFGTDHAVLSAAEIERVAGLFDEIGQDANEFIAPLKKSFARPRPFVREPKITICVPLVTGFSYPSGHATLGRLSARVFALVFPGRADSLRIRGDEVGSDRVLGGVHSVTDIRAGQNLADLLFDALTRSPEFNRRMSEIRTQNPFYNAVRYFR